MSGKTDLLSLLPEELETLIEDLGEKKFRAAQVFEWLYRHGTASVDEMTNLPKGFRARLARVARVGSLPVLAKREAVDGQAAKYLLGLPDGHAVETVLMRYLYGNSICVSTQVGCRMGCTFCASAIGGLVRNLEPGEIAGQVLALRRDFPPGDPGVHSVVLMGTGEPLDNYGNVLKFMRLLNEPRGMNLSFRKMTLSTSGLVPEISHLARENIPITLSVSLHAANDTLRNRLMPVNKTYPLRKLIPACREYGEITGRRVTYEYALISGVNDSVEAAQELGHLLRGSLSHVNLIPLNPVKERDYQRSPAPVVQRFRETVLAMGVSTTVRRELGTGIDAACGQLRRQSGQVPASSEAGGEDSADQRSD